MDKVNTQLDSFFMLFKNIMDSLAKTSCDGAICSLIVRLYIKLKCFSQTEEIMGLI